MRLIAVGVCIIAALLIAFGVAGSRSDSALCTPTFVIVLAVFAAVYGLYRWQRARTIRAQFPEHAAAILAGQVTPGMTPAMVRAALGNPNEIGESTTAQQARIIWRYFQYYRRRRQSIATITFVDNLVESVKR